jgi:hypothetical protein
MQLHVSGFVLHDSTPVKLRLTRNVSSADADVGDTVDFDVVEDIFVGNTLVIARGASAIATVTQAQKKRRMGRGGKLDINIDYVRAVDGEKVALRAVKETNGGGHVGAMTGAIVATSLVFWPAAPFFLLMHGKDITIPKGKELTAYSNGEIGLDIVKFMLPVPVAPAPVAASVPVAHAPGAATSAAPVEVAVVVLKSPKLTNADILTMKNGGLSDVAIIAKIKASGAAYNLEVSDLVELQKTISSEVIAAMIEASR